MYKIGTIEKAHHIFLTIVYYLLSMIPIGFTVSILGSMTEVRMIKTISMWTLILLNVFFINTVFSILKIKGKYLFILLTLIISLSPFVKDYLKN